MDDLQPNSGWLYFFYDRYTEPWGFDPEDRGSCRVVYADCDRSELTRAELPSDMESEHVAAPCRVEARLELTLTDYPEELEDDDDAYDDYFGALPRDDG